MNEFKGTSAPWFSRKENRTIFIYNRDGVLVSECDQHRSLGFENPTPEANDSNAKLIAAAPDLLEALMSIENDDNSIPKAIWDMRNAAIKKATE